MGQPISLIAKDGGFGATARPWLGAAQLLRAAVAGLFAFTLAATAAAEAPRLGMPLECEPGKTCFVQHFVDVAPDAGTQDFRCGHATYKGHTGVDFRVLSAAAHGVRVVAAASGQVKGRRDGMADAFPREAGKALIANRECGNGVVIDHGDGWETQYCHMRQGSVLVDVGQPVDRGAPLGEVGFSGLADSAHLHLTVRHEGKIVDPFTGRSPDGTCLRDRTAMTALFDEPVLKAFPYVEGEFLQSGFALRILTFAELERDHTAGQPATVSGDALVFFARLTHLRAGDRIEMSVNGPGGFAVATPGVAVESDKAIYIAHAGKKRTLPRWPAGVYEGEAHLVRDGSRIRSTRATFTMP